MFIFKENKSKILSWICTALAVLLVNACFSDNFRETIAVENQLSQLIYVDREAPVPGDNGLLSISNIKNTSLILSWTKADDDFTDQDRLQYMIYRSYEDNISTIEDAELNGTPVTAGWTVDVNTLLVLGLSEKSLYYFSVFVRDESYNTSFYNTVSAETSGELDADAPVPGNYGTIITSLITGSSIKLQWVKADDVMTPKAALEYRIYYSESNNISTYGEALLNGTDAGPGWIMDIGDFTVTGLSGGTVYYFNVFVRDEANNVANYISISAETD